MTTDTCQWCKGYQEMAAWLEGKSIPSAQHALDSRLATLNGDPYNEGGTTATRDYIAGNLAVAEAPTHH